MRARSTFFFAVVALMLATVVVCGCSTIGGNTTVETNSTNPNLEAQQEPTPEEIYYLKDGVLELRLNGTTYFGKMVCINKCIVVPYEMYSDSMMIAHSKYNSKYHHQAYVIFKDAKIEYERYDYNSSDVGWGRQPSYICADVIGRYDNILVRSNPYTGEERYYPVINATYVKFREP